MFEYKLQNEDSEARAWEFTTEHWNIKTPVFMPVGTKATVKWITNQDLDEMWAEIILNNTYHLYLKPGDTLIKKFWWSHSFMNYQKPILTDSWGFQVFSLGKWLRKWWKSMVKINEDGVRFTSFIDGSTHFFNAENVMDIQSNIWADIIMAFDECAPWDSSYSYAKEAMNRTHRWAERCIKRRKHNNQERKKQWIHEQALFPIIQGVTYDELRKESAQFMAKLDTPWIAIGGLAVWETKEDMYRTIDNLKGELPRNKPRYLMGVWTPEDLVECIYRGMDMFDCVLPTRLGRHGVWFTSKGNIKITNQKFQFDKWPIDDECECKTCRNHSKWYIRHLIHENEMLGMQLLSYHNLSFLIQLTKKAREAILENRYWEFRENFWNKYNS
jgi:queuine tRNA-ribosyltransferase